MTCPLCNGNDLLPVTDKVRFGLRATVMSCRSCSLVFLDQDSFSFPKDFYEHDYHQTYLTHVEPDAVDPARYFDKMTRAIAPWVRDIKKHLTDQTRLLDVGCSTGHLLVALRDSVKSVHGSELSRKEVQFCTEHLKLDVSAAPLGERFADESFDVITLFFVLEHIGKPLEFLQHLKRFLKKDGTLIIVVPNVRDALVSFYDIPKFREFYFCIEHLFYYSADTLRSLLGQAGFEGIVESVQEYPITNHLQWMYLGKPSDTLGAREGLPPVAFPTTADTELWRKFWDSTNEAYKSLLGQSGFGDRVWCVVKKI